ncbi:MAG: hypothetical protein IJU75_07470 [Clostridia bacterium]|nr:hypothetical protein [Clostridia bacterium]
MPQLLFLLYTSGAINEIYGLIAVSLLVIAGWQWARERQIFLYGVKSLSFLTLMLFSVLYVLFGERNIQGIEFYILCPALAFLCGWVTVEVGRDDPRETIRKSVYFMLIGYAVHAVLNYSVNIGHKRWELIDFFSKSIHAATGSGSINTLIFSLSVYFLIIEKNRYVKLAGIAGTAVSLIYAFLLGTRTQFLILLIVSAVVLFVHLKEKYGMSSAIRFAVTALILIGIAALVYGTDMFGVRTYIQSTNLSERYIDRDNLNEADDYRVSSIGRGIANAFLHPFGGLKATEYYHNFWLDAGRVAGLFPLIALIVYSLVTNVHALRMIRNRGYSASFRYLLLCVYLGIQINFFAEPVLEGLRGFFFVFLIINGMTECCYYKYEADSYRRIDEPDAYGGEI